jgi:hypothetical protein
MDWSDRCACDSHAAHRARQLSPPGARARPTGSAREAAPLQRRYATPLTEVFSRQHKLHLEWRVELALLKALGEVGKIPAEAHDEIKKIIDCERPTCSRGLEQLAKRTT